MIRVPSPYFHSLKIIIIIFAGLIFDLKPIAVVQLVIQSRYMRYTEEHQLTVSLCQSCVCVRVWWWWRRKLIRLVDLIQSHRSKEMTSHWFHLNCLHTSLELFLSDLCLQINKQGNYLRLNNNIKWKQTSFQHAEQRLGFTVLKKEKKKKYRIQKTEGKLQVLLLYRYVSATSIGADWTDGACKRTRRQAKKSSRLGDWLNAEETSRWLTGFTHDDFLWNSRGQQIGGEKKDKTIEYKMLMFQTITSG